MPKTKDASSRMIDAAMELFQAGAERLREENPLLESLTDSATGLFNAAYTHMKLADEFKRTRRFREPLTLIAVGPASGQADAAWLRDVAGVFLCESRDIDHLGRLDESTLLMVLPHTDRAGGLVMARRILDALNQSQDGSSDDEAATSAVAGVLSFEGPGFDSPDALLSGLSATLAAAQAGRLGRIAQWDEGGPVAG